MQSVHSLPALRVRTGLLAGGPCTNKDTECQLVDDNGETLFSNCGSPMPGVATYCKVMASNLMLDSDACQTC